MVLFPEGGFLKKRLEVSQKYAAKNNLPLLKNVTLPRVGALKAIMEVIPPHNSMGNNNAAKRTENGNVRPFGSQGIEHFSSNATIKLNRFVLNIYFNHLFLLHFHLQSTFFNIKIKKTMTQSGHLLTMYWM